MAEESRPLTDFRLTRSLNGGWILSVSVSFATQADTYSYSSDHDMLAALPELIGAERVSQHQGVQMDAMKSHRSVVDVAYAVGAIRMTLPEMITAVMKDMKIRGETSVAPRTVDRDIQLRFNPDLPEQSVHKAMLRMAQLGELDKTLDEHLYSLPGDGYENGD